MRLLQDLRYAIRTLTKSPGFAAVAVITLALGIGANTAIFSVIDAVMLKMLPVKDPEELLLLQWSGARPGIIHVGYGGASGLCSSFSYPLFQEFQKQEEIFSEVFGFAPFPMLNVKIEGQPSLAEGEGVTESHFSGLGVVPVLGRGLTARDARPDALGVAVISHKYWTRQFGRDPSVIGKQVSINTLPFTIVGVAPPEFFGVDPGRAPDVWIPLTDHPQLRPWGLGRSDWSFFTKRDLWWLMVITRLKSGVTDQQATTVLDVLLRREAEPLLEPAPHPDQVARVVISPAARGLERLRQQFSTPLFVLVAAAGLILLIACANVAGSLLARAMNRQREIGIRLAIGATRFQLIRQLLTESVLVAALGGMLGVLFAYWGVEILLGIVASGTGGIMLSVEPNLRVLAFTAALSLLVGIVFGLVPALEATRINLTPALKTTAGAIQGTRARSTLARGLVTAQISLSMLLLVGAALFVRTLTNLVDQDLGFNPERVILFRLDPTQKGYRGSHLVNLYGQLLERMQALPGATASFSVLRLISGGAGQTDSWSIEGRKTEPDQQMSVYWNIVGPDFFETMQIPLMAGRGIEWQDTENAPKVAVVNRRFARRVFGEESPIGHRFKLGRMTYEIIGLVENAKYTDLRREPPPTVYFPYTQAELELGAVHFAVRSAGDPGAVVSALSRLVQEIDPDLPVMDLRTQGEQIEGSLMQERLFARLSGFFGLLGLLITSIGLYGLLAYSVSRRTSEIGIRMALGADRTGILRMVMQQGLLLTLIGIGLGLAGVFALARYLESLLYRIAPTDPLTVASIATILLGVALLASLIPARRAASVDPMVALRYE